MSRFFKTYEHFSRSFLKKAKEKTGKSQKNRKTVNMLEDAYKVDEVFELKNPMTSYVYSMIYNGEELGQGEYDELITTLSDNIIEYKNTKEWAEHTGTYSVDDKRTEEFQNLLKNTRNNFGVYFLYNSDKEIIYIGKSTRKLSERAYQSSVDKNAQYIKLYYPKSKADTTIYELYYINKYKPVCNKESKEKDDITLEFPILECSELIKVYADIDLE